MSTTRLIKAAWTAIVFSGFMFAGFLIWESFDNWHRNPVATTISTYPIEMVSFPKIYVCPPKHTYTNLNHDIRSTQNMSLTHEQVDELKSLIDQQIENVEYEKIKKDVDIMVEHAKFYNWYMGLSEMTFPHTYYYEAVKHNYDFSTWSSQGFIRTPYFGEKYRSQDGRLRSICTEYFQTS